jgi:hypothetical protein
LTPSDDFDLPVRPSKVASQAKRVLSADEIRNPYYKPRTNQNLLQKAGGFLYVMSSILWDNKFFESIFPLIKQQKPGKDLYVWQFLTQLIICFFILIFFTSMTSQQNTIAAQFYTNSLSGSMVITLFVMIFVMIIDRIIYSTSVFRSKPEPLVVNGVRNVAEL